MEGGEESLAARSLKRRVQEDHAEALVIYGENDHPTITSTCKSLAEDIAARLMSGRVVQLSEVSHQFMSDTGYSEEAGRRALSEMVSWFVDHPGSG